jgi:phospholipid/cholesterol/gamma-HCH transport system permease protein
MAAPSSEPVAPGLSGSVQRLGMAGLALGDCLRLYVDIARGRARLDVPALARDLRYAGLSMLPALTLVAASVGAILGHENAALAEDFDLPGRLLLSVAYAVTVEMIPVLVGILVAGRAGVLLAVRQAGMAASGELDGLLVSGLNPIQYTLGPMLLAMLAMSFAFAVWGTLVTFGATMLWLWLDIGVPPGLFLNVLRESLTAADLAEVLAKPPVFALLVALVATVNGSLAGRDPHGVARAATRTMIGAVTVILVTDLFFVLVRGG